MKTFEKLNVYQEARELIRDIYKITKNTGFIRDYDLVRQIRRAAISIAANIAEGYERGSNNEFMQFLFIAKGSCGELRVEIDIAYDERYISEGEKNSIIKRSIKISSMLSNLIKSIKKSGYKGQKRD